MTLERFDYMQHADGSEFNLRRDRQAFDWVDIIPGIPHPQIAAASTGPRWNQFYPIPDIDSSKESLMNYQDLGTKAIIITVDQQASVYEGDLHDRNLGGVVRGAILSLRPALKGVPHVVQT